MAEKHEEYLQRLLNYAEHGIEARDEDFELASVDPHALVTLAVKAGQFSRFENERQGGPSGPLTQRAVAFIRASEVAFHVADEMRQRLEMGMPAGAVFKWKCP